MSIFISSSSKDHIEKLSQGNTTTLGELTTGVPLERLNRHPLKKFAFLFEDQMKTSDEVLYVDEHKWL